MGIGNLQRALAAYGAGAVPYAQLYFDSTPVRHAAAWRLLAGLGDDSSTYLWRIMAAREIMRLYRDDPAGLAVARTLQARKASAEEVLHPTRRRRPSTTRSRRGRARASPASCARSTRAELRAPGCASTRGWASWPPRCTVAAALPRAAPARAAVLEAIGAATKEHRAAARPLVVTSTVRDHRYQRVLAARNLEATRAFSLHTTGWAFDIARSYRTRAQALAFQFVLDRLTALD